MAKCYNYLMDSWNVFHSFLIVPRVTRFIKRPVRCKVVNQTVLLVLFFYESSQVTVLLIEP